MNCIDQLVNSTENIFEMSPGKYNTEELPMAEQYPVLALRNLTVFPENIVPLAVGRKRSVSLILSTAEMPEGDEEVLLIAQRDKEVDNPSQDDLYTVGTVAKILKIVKVGSSSGVQLNVMAQCIKRVRLIDLDQTGEYDIGTVEDFPIADSDPLEVEARFLHLKEISLSMVDSIPNVPKEAGQVLTESNDPLKLAFFVAGNLDITVDERQDILEQEEMVDLLKKVSESVSQQIESTKTMKQLQEKVASETERTQKEWYLRKQMEEIKKQLGEEDGLEGLVQRIEDAHLPEEVEATCLKQIDRLRGMQKASSEYSVTLNYVETLLDVPWSVQSDDNLDLDEAQEILDADHHGLDKVKTRIVEYLAVRKLKNDMKGPILCLAGPPGVGKTSLGKSIARTLGRKFVRISLGGVHDESEIRGHRRTYVGAMPGRLAKALIKAGTNNPVILLDEIDKIGKDFRGDPQAAMLEVLDPEQNNTFADHYIELPLDLSNVLFLATANQLEGISGPLKDRMEIIHVPSYTSNEKLQIAKKHLVPKQLSRHGILTENLDIQDEALKHVINRYTREAGVRNLERRVADLCRSVAVTVAKTDENERADIHVTCDPEYVTEKLGPERYTSEVKQRVSVAGVSTGLAWTSVGGDVLFVESAKMPGNGKLKLTGQLGDVMKESASAALTFLRSNARDYNLSKEVFEEQDLHIHFPAGAIPKDGPSAGVTIFTSLLSTLTGVKVRNDVAMTGEITLRGTVLPVGGIKEKLTAAHRAGIKRVLIPQLCVKDLVDLPEEVREGLEIIPLETVEQIPELALDGPLPSVPVIEGGDRKSVV